MLEKKRPGYKYRDTEDLVEYILARFNNESECEERFTYLFHKKKMLEYLDSIIDELDMTENEELKSIERFVFYDEVGTDQYDIKDLALTQEMQHLMRRLGDERRDRLNTLKELRKSISKTKII